MLNKEKQELVHLLNDWRIKRENIETIFEAIKEVVDRMIAKDDTR